MFLGKFDDRHDSILATRVPKPVNPAALSVLPLLEALSDLRLAEKALEKAKDKVPNYTGQWSDADYYAQEQHEYNRAIERAAYELAAATGTHLVLDEPVSPFQVSMSRTIEEALPDLSSKERKYCEGLIYVGDLVEKIDKASGYVALLTFKTSGVLRSIPARQGLEDWVRP
jgi:hypothetical protein